MRRTELVTDESRLAELAPAWDELAVERGRPYSAPHWALAWWRHARPREAVLRVVALLEDGELVGIAPFAAARGPFRSAVYRLLASSASARVEPLARAGRAGELADAVGTALAAAEPHPDLLRFEGVPEAAPWPESIREAWPGRRPALVEETTEVAPVLSLGSRSMDEFLAARGRHFRKRMNSARRQLEQAGGSAGLARQPEDLERGLRAFAAFHHARFRDRGGSSVLTPGVERMLEDVAREQAAAGRFRVWLVDLGGRAIAAELFLAAGGEVASWLGGFDLEQARRQPSIQALYAAVEHAHEHGETRVDFGPGDHGFKRRFADGDETLRWTALVPRGRRHAAMRLALAGGAARRTASERVPEPAKRVVRPLLRRR